MSDLDGNPEDWFSLIVAEMFVLLPSVFEKN